MNKSKFYDSIRPHVNLTMQNVSGMEKVLDYGIARKVQINHFAYTIATGWWETAATMQPVREAFWKDENWRRENLRYYPWYGRGLVQTTWEANYRKMTPIVGVDLIVNPDALLQWQYALPALFIGMERGLYTGKSLSDYIDNIDESDSEDYKEYVNARRVVNSTDKAATIATLALQFEKGLRDAGYVPGGVTMPTPTPIPVEQPVVGWFAVIVQKIKTFFGW